MSGDGASEPSVDRRIRDLESEVRGKIDELAELRRQLGSRPVPDHTLTEETGRSIRLSELFGDRSDLLVIHNMGKSCPYCTLWADGIDGFLPHLENRTAVVLVSPDPPEVQRAFARERGWQFRMISGQGSSFTRDLGFESEQEGKRQFMPGYSTFQRTHGGEIRRIAHDYFGPGDLYMPLWHMIRLLADGEDGWRPRFRYDE